MGSQSQRAPLSSARIRTGPLGRNAVAWFYFHQSQDVRYYGARNACPLVFKNNSASTHSASLPHNRSILQQGREERNRRTWSPCVFPLFTLRIQLKHKSPECVHCSVTRHVPNFWFVLSSRETDSGFSDVSFSDEEVIDFPGFVHVYLDERSCLCQSQASLLVTLIQQSRLIL